MGEEYCDLFQTDPRGAAPGAARRWALVLLDAFAEPAMRRVRARARAAADRRAGDDRAGDAATGRRRRRRVDVVVGVFSRRHRTRASALRVVRGDRARRRVLAVVRPRAPRDGRPDARRARARAPRAFFRDWLLLLLRAPRGGRALRVRRRGGAGREAAARAAGVPARRAARVRGVRRLFSKHGGCASRLGKRGVETRERRVSRERRRRRRIRAKDDAVVRDARGGRVASIGGDVSECVSTTRRESRRRLCLVVVSAGPKEVRAVFIRARRARGDAMRARLLLVVRRELVRAKAGVPVVSRARRAAVARSRRGVLRREAREARGLRRERTVVYRSSRS